MDLITQFLDGFKQFFEHHIVFSTGMLLLTGYFAGRLAERLKLPAITGYIVAGLFLGDSFSGIVHETMAYRLNSITEIALGLIAITIGAEFDLAQLRRTGRTILIITFFQALFAFIFVVVGLLLLNMRLSYTLILGAIATATAPAATVMIVRELRARGQFVDTLYGVVALDDALCVIIFSLVFALVAPILIGKTVPGVSGIMAGLGHALREIGLSILLGGVGGVGLHYFSRRKYKLNEVLIISVAVIFLIISLAIILELSLLIANMVLGAVLVNLNPKNRRIFRVIEPITPPIFALFFILAGTELDISVFSRGLVVLFGGVYIVSRFLGKYAGTYLSAMLTRSSHTIRNWMGLCLFPQAGVAIGLVLFVQTSPLMLAAPEPVKEMLVMIVNIVLFSIFINELIGPAITRHGIVRGAELKEMYRHGYF